MLLFGILSRNILRLFIVYLGPRILPLINCPQCLVNFKKFLISNFLFRTIIHLRHDPEQPSRPSCFNIVFFYCYLFFVRVICFLCIKCTLDKLSSCTGQISVKIGICFVQISQIQKYSAKKISIFFSKEPLRTFNPLKCSFSPY